MDHIWLWKEAKVVDVWVVLANIKRFQDMLKAETDPERLSTLEALLAAEVTKIKSIEDVELAKQAWEQYLNNEGRS
ncbi:hypothetical protein [Rhizobium sp. BK491]|uniref:hypothetical protein n=1 Tax=Rhizobium sp. BK491 TaxID=2587009 RepID=UPI000DDF8D4F|nr:hypothetical protein [Rhizobium sp. BK491]MBB3572035.1 hypothetical protein [Rhizobium sp. BK491]